jgi:hypothetical protein
VRALTRALTRLKPHADCFCWWKHEETRPASQPRLNSKNCNEIWSQTMLEYPANAFCCTAQVTITLNRCSSAKITCIHHLRAAVLHCRLLLSKTGTVRWTLEVTWLHWSMVMSYDDLQCKQCARGKSTGEGGYLLFEVIEESGLLRCKANFPSMWRRDKN